MGFSFDYVLFGFRFHMHKYFIPSYLSHWVVKFISVRTSDSPYRREPGIEAKCIFEDKSRTDCSRVALKIKILFACIDYLHALIFHHFSMFGLIRTIKFKFGVVISLGNCISLG